MKPRVSVIVTAHNEGDSIVPYLDRLLESVTLPCEVLVVFDSPDDTTAPWVDVSRHVIPSLGRLSVT
jgi:glycosyltransferase involved in cell wall biosynthesis